MRLRTVMALGLGGVALLLLAYFTAGLPLRDAVILVSVAGGAAALVGAAGALVLTVLRGASILAQVSVVALTSVAAVAVGALAAGSAMFISTHDLAALTVVLAAAAFVGVVVAMTLAQRAEMASRSLSEAARRLTEESPPPPGRRGRGVSIREFAALEDQLRDAAARLEEARAAERSADAARRELVSWVSHDLRTPLAGIRAVTEALEDGVVTDPATVRGYYTTLREEADRLAVLVDDLFELSRISAGALRLNLERVNLGELVSDALVAVSPVASAKGVRLEAQVDGGAPELALSVPEFVRVLRNLLENAIRETPSDGAVWVEAGVEGGQAFVVVRDSCGGIPDDDLPRVFETAFRGSTARTPAPQAGAGLGLAIAKGLVEAHQGRIGVANHGPGCEFRVLLPLGA